MSQKPTKPRKPRQSKYDEVNDPAFKISDTPENIAKAILQSLPKSGNNPDSSKVLLFRSPMGQPL